MVNLAHSIAIAVIVFDLGALGSPVSIKATPENPITDDLLGFDETYQGDQPSHDTRDEAVLPEIVRWDQDLFTNDTSAVATPFAPSSSSILTPQRRRRFIFGAKDNRELWNMETYPFQSVGRLQWKNGVFCSGALVGPRHVLTARHCLPDDPISGNFAPGYDEETRFGSGQIVAAMTSTGQKSGSPCDTKADWAVLVLDKRLGNKLGYFGVKTPDSSLLGQSIFYHLAYPGDLDGGRRPYRMLDVKVLREGSLGCDSTGPLHTNADTAGGQSGGPIWELDDQGNRWIWGALSIGVSWGDGLGYAAFASGAEMIDAINRLRKKYP